MKTQLQKTLFSLLVCASLCLLTGCAGDGDTTSSAMSNGMISDPDVNSRFDRSDAQDTTSESIADDLSDAFSRVESGAEDIASDVGDAVSELLD